MSETKAASTVDNGIGLNGIGLNGIGLNGIGLNGIGLNGIGLNGIGLNGIGLNGIGLNGIGLNGIGLNGTEITGVGVAGTDLVGATFPGLLSNGMTLPLVIVGASQFTDPAPSATNEGKLWQYEVMAKSDSGLVPICNGPYGNQVLAVANRWDLREGVAGGGSEIVDPAVFTFACRGVGAIAKCVEDGYKPYLSVNGTSLRPHHQACTRMLRADYCGDGSTHTDNGVLIDIYDGVGVQASTTNWAVDAEWTEAGARCVSVAVALKVAAETKGAPECVYGIMRGDCGQSKDFRRGALVADKNNLLEDPRPVF